MTYEQVQMIISNQWFELRASEDVDDEEISLNITDEDLGRESRDDEATGVEREFVFGVELGKFSSWGASTADWVLMDTANFSDNFFRLNMSSIVREPLALARLRLFLATVFV